MDFLKEDAETAVNAANNNNQQQSGQNSNDSNNNGLGFISGNGAVDGVLGNLNGALGAGKEGEAKEDVLGKGTLRLDYHLPSSAHPLSIRPAIDVFQEKVLKEGVQNNESLVEQTKNETFSDFIREIYKSATGKGFP
ncbi:hypothetical protein H1R20_g2842, partial [Candolleomyces eurysporus]